MVNADWHSLSMPHAKFTTLRLKKLSGVLHPDGIKRLRVRLYLQ